MIVVRIKRNDLTPNSCLLSPYFSFTLFCFTILQHNTTGDEYHWDFLYEQADACLTFSVPKEAVNGKEIRCVATRLPDHRLAYLEYEGPVSGNRGVVRRIDSGKYEIDGNTIRFQGNIWHGTINLDTNEIFSTM